MSRIVFMFLPPSKQHGNLKAVGSRVFFPIKICANAPSMREANHFKDLLRIPRFLLSGERQVNEENPFHYWEECAGDTSSLGGE